MISFYRFFLGFVRIYVFGLSPERFINYCALNGISVWNIKRKKDGIYLNIGISDYKNIRKVRRKIDNSIRIKLKEKHGLVFISRKFLKRPGIVVGIAVFFIINIAFSQFIWDIDVVGAENIDTNKIVSVCDELGVSVGMPRNSVDTYNVSQLLALRFEEIAWVSLNIEGTNLTVNISVASDSDKNQETTPSNIVASYDGVIKSAKITHGKNEFTLGQAVRKGDLLVSGVVSNDVTTQFVHSKGEIIAKTHRSFDVEINKYYKCTLESKNYQCKNILKVFWLEIPLYLSGADESLDSSYNTFSLKLFGEELPIKMIQRKFQKRDIITLDLTEDQAAQLALAETSKTIKNLPIKNVENYKVNVYEDGDIYKVLIEIDCLEDIAMQQAIEGEY